MNKLIVFIIAL